MIDNNNIVDSRGFITYGTIIDSYGAEIRVKESSNANPHVRIFVQGGDLTNNNGSAHLNIKQARAVRDALTKWIDEIPDRWDLTGEEE